jgi:hypothetical protein
MRHLLFLLAGAGLVAGHELATDYGRVRTLETSSEFELDLETTLRETTVNGEPVEGRGGPGGGGSSLVRKCVLVDEFLEGEKGGARHAKRTFATLHDESRFSFGEEERTDERDFPLAGLTLEFTRDEAGELASDLVEGSEPEDESLLEGHLPALALDALLPDGAVEGEATWALDDEAIKAALATVLDARYFAEPPPEERPSGERGERGGGRGRGFGRGGSARSLTSLVWKGEAKLAATDEEHDGLTCAKIELELEGEGELPEPSFRGPPRDFAFLPRSAAPLRAGTISARLDGTLFVSLEQARPVALTLDGEIATESSFEREREGEVFATRTRQEGRFTLHVTVTQR